MNTHMCVYIHISVYIPSYHRAASRIQVCTPDLDQKPFMIDVQDIPGGAAGSGKVTYLSFARSLTATWAACDAPALLRKRHQRDRVMRSGH